MQFRRNKSEGDIDKFCACLFVFVLPLTDVIKDLKESNPV